MRTSAGVTGIVLFGSFAVLRQCLTLQLQLIDNFCLTNCVIPFKQLADLHVSVTYICNARFAALRTDVLGYGWDRFEQLLLVVIK